MYLYHGTVNELFNITGKQLIQKLKDIILKDEELRQVFYKNDEFNEKELRAWENSIPAITNILYKAGLGDLELILEYSIPFLNERMDVIVVGRNYSNNPVALIIELKQWRSIIRNSSLTATKVRIPEDRDEEKEEREHPCSQLRGYVNLLNDNHEVVASKDRIAVEYIAFLHNFEEKEQLFDAQYSVYRKDYWDKVFVKGEEDELSCFLKNLFVSHACKDDYKLITEGAFQNPKDFFASIDTVLADKKISGLVQEQRAVQSEIFHIFRKNQKEKIKTVFIVSGGPGTGKSVLGLYCMSFYSKYLQSQKAMIYATQNRTLREIMASYISDKNKKYRSSIVNAYNCVRSSSKIPFLIVDEAQRLGEIEKILPKLVDQSSVLLLLQDDRQRVRIKEQGTRENLARIALEQENVEVISNLSLTVNHRNGSSPVYESVVNSFLYNDFIESGRKRNFGNYDVKIEEHLSEIEEFLLLKKQEGNRCKWLAPYCWSWDQRDEWSIDIRIFEENFEKPWNPQDLSSQSKWYKDEDTNGNQRINQVGCVYTSQGLVDSKLIS